MRKSLVLGGFVALALGWVGWCLLRSRAAAQAPEAASAPRAAGAARPAVAVAKARCTNSLAVTASATEDLNGNSFLASYTLVSCQSKTRVSMTATDLSTGNVVWASVPDLAGTVRSGNLVKLDQLKQ